MLLLLLVCWNVKNLKSITKNFFLKHNETYFLQKIHSKHIKRSLLFKFEKLIKVFRQTDVISHFTITTKYKKYEKH